MKYLILLLLMPNLVFAENYKYIGEVSIPNSTMGYAWYYDEDSVEIVGDARKVWTKGEFSEYLEDTETHQKYYYKRELAEFNCKNHTTKLLYHALYTKDWIGKEGGDVRRTPKAIVPGTGDAMLEKEICSTLGQSIINRVKKYLPK